MKPTTFFASCLVATLAAASPIPKPAAQPLPLVSLSLIGEPTHYSAGAAQNPQLSTSTATNAWSIHIPIDISLDLSARPEYVQALEIVGVEEGFGLQDEHVYKDDTAVVCKASLGSGSEGVIVRVGGERVLVDGGKVGKVTGVMCWKEEA
ncbi:hypothetical protein DDE82_006701 [Stemphylium lycopersici]|uniref:Uncharacterized protein n=1 Tax=Stemphylium lycopersici TaxID=183478 RepID=A0A364MVY9_STELY|nr:hypothetical protein TW65_08457 [Stemphylium lycopersici]RAR01129.1 hypothetical protein DDE82_006701 [Stemphylium lycopersici]RAR04778.1 hypothetical protein DDE83_007680 [Stemphylium lycopersici]